MSPSWTLPYPSGYLSRIEGSGMNKKFIISALIAGALCLLPIENTHTTFRRPEKSYAAGRSLYSGLIEKCALKCSGQDGIISITAKTQSSGKMKKIGFTDMTIQRSSDQSHWKTEKDLGNLLGSNVRFYTLDNYIETVDGGYYYRVVCDHYAEGVPVSGDDTQIQETPNASKDVWIDPDPYLETTVTTTTAPRTTITTTKPVTTTSKKVVTTVTVVNPINHNASPQSSDVVIQNAAGTTTTTTPTLFGPVSYNPKNSMSSQSSGSNKGGNSSVINGGGSRSSKNSSSSDNSNKKSNTDNKTSSPKTGSSPPTAAAVAALSALAAAFVIRRKKY